MVSSIYWDPDPAIFTLPFVDWPILWYGFFFSLGFLIGFPVFASILARYLAFLPEYKQESVKHLKEQAVLIADRLTIYVVIGTIVGARLGHFLFYEPISEFLQNPLEIFRVWKGGLASHGASVGIILSIFAFSYRMRSRYPFLHWIRLLDFLAVPAAFAGCCIRLGNFFNQEILGTVTEVPWGVIFGHPFDGSLPAARHPVQIYEAIGYLGLFFILWKLTFYPYFFKHKGKLIGIFLISVFVFRFFIEFFKIEQSRILSPESFLTMGQILSIPMVVLGVIFFSKKS
jgi:phosphatidylglycerol:prolipoprotein diacylglycerol transferase